MLVQNLHRIVRSPNVTPGQIPHCTTDCIPINLVFQENFPTNTEVRNSLCRRNDSRERRVIWVTNGCYNSNLNKVRNISHQEIKYSTTRMGRADNKLTTNWQQLRSQRPDTVAKSHLVVVEHNHALLMMAIQITHKQERGTHILSLHSNHWCQ